MIEKLTAPVPPLSLQEKFAGVVARVVVELVFEPVETQSRHRVACVGGWGSPRGWRWVELVET